MSKTQPVELHSAGPLAELVNAPGDLLDLTLDQLRTLVVVRRMGTALSAARRLGREQSSVQKQLNTMNDIAQRLIGESFVIKQGRGQDVLFTPTGESLVELAEATLDSWLTSTHSARRRLGSTVTVGTTEFTIRFVGEIWPRLQDDFERREIELKVVHVRTRDFWEKLDSQQVDLVCGSFATRLGELPALDYDFIEWHREGVALLTNLSTRELPSKPVSAAKLPSLPLLAPTAGLLAEFLRRWFGPDYRNKLSIIAEIDALYYGLGLLDSRLLHGCLLTTSQVARAAVEGRLPGGHDLRAIPLANDLEPPLELVTGVFGRRNERQHYAPEHPVNLLWKEFKAAAPEQTTTSVKT
ncbi:LysR family transcriptional regulator [Actinophytocola sp.]|uniref:LysR family transcriptional regulator n=1 Tax=Actinophytocola sp. TaxID=1872138 RepID=UPI003D6C1D7A